jgi:hypothetical protein
MKINWGRKLSSRKFWALAAGLATSVLVLTKVDENTAAQVMAVIGAFGSVVTYMLAEAYVDGQATASKDKEAG